MPEKHNVLDHPALRDVRGWLTPREADLLHEAAMHCPADAAVVEIGSAQGKSTICLALGSNAGNRAPVSAIDPHVQGTLDVFRANLERGGVGDIVTPIVATSEAAVRDWSKPIGVLFIDGDHSNEAVMNDFLSWSPHVIPGGLIAMHDTTASIMHRLGGYPGPMRVANRFLFDPATMCGVGVVGTTTYARRHLGAAGGADRARHRVRCRKALTDLVLVTHAHIERRLPGPVRRSTKRLIEFISRVPQGPRAGARHA